MKMVDLQQNKKCITFQKIQKKTINYQHFTPEVRNIAHDAQLYAYQ